MTLRWEALKVVRQKGTSGIIKWQSSDEVGKLWVLYDECHADLKVVLKLKDQFAKEQILESTDEKLLRNKLVKGQALGSTLAFKYHLAEEGVDVQYQVKFRWEFEARDCQQMLSPYIVWSMKQLNTQSTQLPLASQSTQYLEENTLVESRTQVSGRTQPPALPESQQQFLMPPPPPATTAPSFPTKSAPNPLESNACIPGLTPDVSMRIMQVIQRGIAAKQDISVQTDVSLLQVDLFNIPNGPLSDSSVREVIKNCLEDKSFPDFCQNLERVWFDMLNLEKV